MRPVALLTDFGLDDHYVGVLHAVLERDAPGVERIDLSHGVTPGDVWQACYLVRCAWPHLPAETVVLAVVDPGVGTERRAIAVRIGERFLVAPDNGLASAISPTDEAVAVQWRTMALPTPSRTFHGRDLFAPAAAWLALGDDVDVLGTPVEPGALVPCPLPEPERLADGWRATVLHCDRFGNLVTNVPALEVSGTAAALLADGVRARRVAIFCDGEPEEVVMLAGSSGLLELVVNGGSAAAVTGLGRGDRIEVVDDAYGSEE
jgi:hypothetical protein